MAQLWEIYRCKTCGAMVEVVRAGGGAPACCDGAAMALLTENTVDASREKHVPVMEKTPAGVTVRVGSIPHPMEEKHFIEWIELILPASGKCMRKFLRPGDAPEASFAAQAEDMIAREHCNIHGLWKGGANG